MPPSGCTKPSRYLRLFATKGSRRTAVAEQSGGNQGGNAGARGRAYDPSADCPLAQEFDRSVHRILTGLQPVSALPDADGGASSASATPTFRTTAATITIEQIDRAKHTDVTVHRKAYSGSSCKKPPGANWYLDPIDDSSKTLHYFAQCAGFALEGLFRFQVLRSHHKGNRFPLLHPQARRPSPARLQSHIGWTTYRNGDSPSTRLAIGHSYEAHHSVTPHTVEHDNQFYREQRQNARDEQK